MKSFRTITAALPLLILGACAAPGPGQWQVQQGTPVSFNTTPYDTAFVCTNGLLANQPRVARMAVGQVKDYTGKFSNEASEGGYKVTQGGALMVISALGKLSKVEQVERFDTQIAEMEIGLSKSQLLRDRQGEAEVVQVPTAGMVQGSDYYIVGGITEVNYNIQSGGLELGITGVGGGARYFVMNVAADLRLVETRTMKVVKTISMQKQVVGEEIKANIFRFFTNQLVDFNAGAKAQEPIQLGVRSTLEAGVLELVTAAFGVDFAPCRDAVNAKFGVQSAAAPTPVADERS